MMSEEHTGYAQRAFEPAADATELILVRHGASAEVVPGKSVPITEGWSDPPLSEVGESQAQTVAKRLLEESFAALFVSGLRRTLETAAPLVKEIGMEPVVVPELREVHIGDWEGGEWRIRIAKDDPVALRAFEEERWDVIPGGERPEVLAARVERGVESMVAAAGSGTVAVAILHAGVIAEICRQATASRPFAFIHVANGSLTRLIVNTDGRWVLRTFNETVHLNGI